jgi:hypothetical protein
VTPRQSQLTAYVKLCLEDERASTMADEVKRHATIESAREVAGDIGFRSDEIDAAVKEALEAAAS